MNGLNQWFNIDVNMSLINSIMDVNMSLTNFSLWYLNICVVFAKIIGIGIVDLKGNLAQISNLVNF